MLNQLAMQLDPATISDWLIGSTLGGCLIAIIASVVGRWGDRPALAHRLWLLAIIKLTLPPIFSLPLTLWAPASPLQKSGMSFHPFRSTMQFTEVTSLLLTVWIVGSVLLAVWVYRSAARVRRLIEYRGRFDIEATGVLRKYAKDQNLQHSTHSFPEVWLVDAFVSPMLYCETARRWLGRAPLAGQPIIVFPRTLWNQMDHQSRLVLLKHELAHWSRRDQRVRWIEVMAMVVLWWHPLIWIARRQIESCEERCCDAAATKDVPAGRRVYAEAILMTLDFLSEPFERDRSEVEARPLASGLSRLPIVRHRLQKIMCPLGGEHGPRLLRSLTSIACCLAAAVIVLLPISPAISIHFAEPTPVSTTSDRPLSVKSVVEMDNSARAEKIP